MWLGWLVYYLLVCGHNNPYMWVEVTAIVCGEYKHKLYMFAKDIHYTRVEGASVKVVLCAYIGT